MPIYKAIVIGKLGQKHKVFGGIKASDEDEAIILIEEALIKMDRFAVLNKWIDQGRMVELQKKRPALYWPYADKVTRRH